MRKLVGIPFVLLFACQGSGPGDTTGQQQSLVCDGADVPIYRNRFAAQAGASGVATAPEAAAGVISSDAPAGGGAAATGSVAVSAAPVSVDPSATPAATDAGTTTAAGDATTFTAMIASCGIAPCSPDQVAVEAPPVVSPSTTVGGPGVGATATSAAAPAADSAAASPSPSAPAANLVCTSPPPPCPEGQSPQFTGKHTWECTDCSLVVTYGGIYGNYRRCVSMPHLHCPDGEVPTWVYEDEQWECKTKCDNGQYDQHTIEGVMVCVPC